LRAGLGENAEAAGNPIEASVPFCVSCGCSSSTKMMAINKKKITVKHGLTRKEV